MEILISNDDSYQAAGIHALVRAMKPFGNITVVAPKYHQSGMSMAVSIGLKPVAAKDVCVEDGVRWIYLDATPASCVKYGLDIVFAERKPDLVLSGINHGSNAGTAALYSGTLGCCKEASISEVPAIGVSLDSLSPKADFSVVEKVFPKIVKALLALPRRVGTYYNVNFPNLPESQIKGIKATRQGLTHWVKEFLPYNPDVYSHLGIKPQDLGIVAIPPVEPGETVLMMAGDNIDIPTTDDADNTSLAQGYITVTSHNIDTTDYEALEVLRTIDFAKEI